MKTLKYLTAISLFGLGSAAHAACAYPEVPSDLPSGDTETQEEMVVAQKAVKSFVADMEAYLACLDADIEALGAEATDEHRLIRDKRYNAAVDVMDATAAEFNQAVRAYKARGQ
jgi:hypothetical protein